MGEFYSGVNIVGMDKETIESAQENRESTLYSEITDISNTDTDNSLVYSYAEFLNSEKYPFPTNENSNARTHGGHLQAAYNITDKHGSSENRGEFQHSYIDLYDSIPNSPEHIQSKANEDMHEDQSSTYSLAQRTAEDDKPDPYTTNMDYNHLSNVC